MASSSNARKGSKSAPKWKLAVNKSLATAANEENQDAKTVPAKGKGKKSKGIPMKPSTGSNNMANAGPELVIAALRNPRVKNYRGLRKLLGNNSIYTKYKVSNFLMENL